MTNALIFIASICIAIYVAYRLNNPGGGGGSASDQPIANSARSQANRESWMVAVIPSLAIMLVAWLAIRDDSANASPVGSTNDAFAGIRNTLRMFDAQMTDIRHGHPVVNDGCRLESVAETIGIEWNEDSERSILDVQTEYDLDVRVSPSELGTFCPFRIELGVASKDHPFFPTVEVVGHEAKMETSEAHLENGEYSAPFRWRVKKIEGVSQNGNTSIIELALPNQGSPSSFRVIITYDYSIEAKDWVMTPWPWWIHPIDYAQSELSRASVKISVPSGLGIKPLLYRDMPDPQLHGAETTEFSSLFNEAPNVLTVDSAGPQVYSARLNAPIRDRIIGAYFVLYSTGKL